MSGPSTPQSTDATAAPAGTTQVTTRASACAGGDVASPPSAVVSRAVTSTPSSTTRSERLSMDCRYSGISHTVSMSTKNSFIRALMLADVLSATWLMLGVITKLASGLRAGPTVIAWNEVFILSTGSVVAEALLAYGLLRGRYRTSVRIATLVLFKVIIAVHVREPDRPCGCFGRFAMSSSFMLAVQLPLLGLLATATVLRVPPLVHWPRIAGLLVVCAIGVAWSCSAFGPQSRLSQPSQPQSGAPAAEVSALLVRWPELRHGAWNVFIYRTGCPDCEAVLPRILERARAEAAVGTRWMLVDVSGAAGDDDSGDPRIVRRSITVNDVQAPVLVRVNEGREQVVNF